MEVHRCDTNPQVDMHAVSSVGFILTKPKLRCGSLTKLNHERIAKARRDKLHRLKEMAFRDKACKATLLHKLETCCSFAAAAAPLSCLPEWVGLAYCTEGEVIGTSRTWLRRFV